jgi:hypothetical protein
MIVKKVLAITFDKDNEMNISKNTKKLFFRSMRRDNSNKKNTPRVLENPNTPITFIQK